MAARAYRMRIHLLRFAVRQLGNRLRILIIPPLGHSTGAEQYAAQSSINARRLSNMVPR